MGVAKGGILQRRRSMGVAKGGTFTEKVCHGSG